MKKYTILPILCLIVLGFSLPVLAANSFPLVPIEYWGKAIVNGTLAIDGLSIEGFVNNRSYEQPSATINGYYNLILVLGDSPLTYLDDSNCSIHWNNNESCIPCSTNSSDEDYCIEGPQNGDVVSVKVDSVGVMPFLEWSEYFNEVEIVRPIADWNKLGCVDMADFTYFANHYSETPLSILWEKIYDVYNDNIIDMSDFTVFANHYGGGCK